MAMDSVAPVSEAVCLPGDHMIYEQKPEECGKLIKNFIDGLDE